MKKESIILSIGAAAALGLTSQAFANNTSLLQTEKLDKGYNQTQTTNKTDLKIADGSCGEGKCGGGKCGGDSDDGGDGDSDA